MKDREQITTNGRAVFYAAMWEDLKSTANDLGWALALHGSLASDMDIMAMPWMFEPCDETELIESLKTCFYDCRKISHTVSDAPNGRRIYTISIWADFYLDINMIHPINQPTK